jgi:Ca2+-binding EF-hand superfamily protein
MTSEPAEIKELRESFRYNDLDKDGRIEFGEFLEMLEQLEARVSAAEARVGFDALDVDRDGAISFEEFLDWWRGR